jgi:hypothetical protein
MPGQASAQAWTMARGEAYVKAFYGKVTAAEQFTFDGRTTDYIDGLAGDTYRDRSLYLYSEIGLSDRFSLIVSAPYKRTFVRDQSFRFRIFGLGTATLGGRIALLPLLGLPTDQNALAANLYFYIPTGYTRNFAPSTGAGQVDIQGSLFYGRSFYPAPAYAQVGAGYRYRSSLYLFSGAAPCRTGSDIHCIADARPSYGDEFLFHAEAGVSPFGGALFLQALATSIWSVQVPVVGFSAINPIPTHQRYIKAGGGIALYPFRIVNAPHLATLGFSVQYFLTPYGRNTIHSRDLFIGIEFRLRLFNFHQNSSSS